mgnify:FL=1
MGDEESSDLLRDPDVVKHILWMLHDAHYSLQQASVELKALGFRASRSIVRRIALEEGYKCYTGIGRPHLSPSTLELRMEYLDDFVPNKDAYYAIAFSDEKIFVSGVVRTGRAVWCSGPDDPLRFLPHQGRQATKLMVLGAIHPVAGGSDLIIFEGTENGTNYATALAHVFLPWATRHASAGTRLVWQDDNAPPHRTGVCKATDPSLR